jgi:SH3 domain-containing protein
MTSTRVKFLLLGLLFTLVSSTAAAQSRKLYPVDEAAQDRSFRIFRDQLLAAARKRDKKFILSIVDPKIQNSFGGDGGIEEFQEMWRLDAQDSELWKVLTDVLSMGGSFGLDEGKRSFEAPYVSSKWQDRFDPFEYKAAIEKKVNVRARASISAPVITKLSYDIVKLEPGDPVKEETGKDSYTWIKVSTPDGKVGYVSDKYLRSPIDYRAGFVKKNGRWVMTYLIAGD